MHLNLRNSIHRKRAKQPETYRCGSSCVFLIKFGKNFHVPFKVKKISLHLDIVIKNRKVLPSLKSFHKYF